MDVDRITEPADFIREYGAAAVIIAVEPVFSVDSAGFAHSQQRRGLHEIGAFKARNVFPVKLMVDLRELASFDIGIGQFGFIQRIRAVDVAEVAAGGSVAVGADADEMMLRNRSFSPLQQFEPDRPVTPAPAQRRIIRLDVDVRELRAKRGTHRPSLRIAAVERHTGKRRNRRIPGCVDENPAFHLLQAMRRGYQQRFDLSVPDHRIGDPDHVKKFHTGFQQPVVIDPFQDFGIHLLPARIDLFDPHFAAAVINDGAAEISDHPVHAIALVDHGRNQCVGSHAAETAGLFQQYHTFAQAGGGQCRGNTGGTASGDDDFSFKENRQIERLKHMTSKVSVVWYSI